MEIVPDHPQAGGGAVLPARFPRRLRAHRPPGLRDGRRGLRPDAARACTSAPSAPTRTWPGHARRADGALYEVKGPFRLPKRGVPASWVFGPPAGERAGLAGLGDRPGLGLSAIGSALRRVSASVHTDRPANLHAVVRSFDLKRESRGDGTHDRPIPVTLARWSGNVAAGSTRLSLALSRLAPSAVLTVVAERDDGTRRVVAHSLKLS